VTSKGAGESKNILTNFFSRAVKEKVNTQNPIKTDEIRKQFQKKLDQINSQVKTQNTVVSNFLFKNCDEAPKQSDQLDFDD